jgi:hypothetical protein
LTPAPPAPLEASDPQRAQTLKRKALDRITDVRRHLNALQAAMAAFGEDFDLDVFQREFDSEDPDELNRVKAVERGVDQLYNYIVELAAFGLELAGERRRFDETNARRDLDALARLGVISRERAARLSGCASTGACSCTSTRAPPPPRCMRPHASWRTSCRRSTVRTASGCGRGSGRGARRQAAVAVGPSPGPL